MDNQGRIIPDLIPELDENTILILQAGNVNSGAFDNFETICEKAKKANAWVHIDGAFGLWAEAVNELKHLTKGIGNATSWAVDGHQNIKYALRLWNHSLFRPRGYDFCSSYVWKLYCRKCTERDGMFLHARNVSKSKDN